MNNNRNLVFFLIVIILLAVLSSVIAVSIPGQFQKLINTGIVGHDVSVTLRLGAFIFFLYIAASVIKQISNYILSRNGLRFTLKIKDQLVNRVLKYPIAYFDTLQSGELTQRIRETDGISLLFSPTIMQIISACFSSIMAIVIIYNINHWLLLIYALAVPIMAFISYKVSTTYQKNLIDMAKLDMKSSGIMQESISGISEIKSLNMIEKRANIINKLNAAIFKKSLWQNLFITMGGELLSIINSLITIIAIIASGILVYSVSGNIGVLFSIMQYSALILAPAQLISSAVIVLQPGIAALKRTRELSGIASAKDDNGHEISEITKVEFRDVSFSYNEDKKVLSHVSFILKKGQSLALVGPNGSGKTTVVKLLLGFYDKYDGQILINGIDLKEISLKSLRNCLAIVFQNVYLFSGSLLENILCDKTVSDKMMEGVLEASGLSLEYGSPEEKAAFLAQDIVEGGKNLSGGQKQKVAIARALMRDPSVLVFDEATSNLDIMSKSIVTQILSVKKNAIKIIITHDTEIANMTELIIPMSNA